MDNISTVTGKIVRFSPEWVKIYPKANDVKLLADQVNFGMYIKPDDGLGINLTFTAKSAVDVANLLETNNLDLAVGSLVVADFTHANGYYFHKLKQVNGVDVTKTTDDTALEQSNNSQEPQVTSEQSDNNMEDSVESSVSSEDNDNVIENSIEKPVSSEATEQSSESDNGSGIESGIASLKALFPDASSSSASNSSMKSSSSVAVSSSVSVDSSVSNEPEPDYSESSSSDLADEIEAEEAENSSASSSYQPVSSSASAINSSSQSRIYYQDDHDSSNSLISKKLNGFNKYHSMLKKDGTYDNTKKTYNALVDKSSADVYGGLDKAYSQEDWRGFTRGLWSHAGVAFNETLNQEITNARMNYALECNVIPGIDKPKEEKPKPKPEHLNDKNVF